MIISFLPRLETTSKQIPKPNQTYQTSQKVGKIVILHFQIERERESSNPPSPRENCQQAPSQPPLPLSLPSDLDRGLFRWKNSSRAELPLGGCRVDWDLARRPSLSTKEKSCNTLRSVRAMWSSHNLTLTSCNLGRKRALR